MAVRNREEILSLINDRFSDDTSDEVLSLIEDVSDTLTELENSRADDTNWKEKYETNDKEWRQKYKERFFNSETTPADAKGEQEDDVKDDAEEKTYADLFEEREG